MEVLGVPTMELVGGDMGGRDEPGIERGRLMEFAAEVKPSCPVPEFCIALRNLFQGMGVIVLTLGSDVAVPIIILIESGGWEG